MRLIGFGDGSYTSKKDGQKKEGYRFYFTDARDNVAGLACEQVWCQKTVGDSFLRSFDPLEDCLGKEFQVLYNRFGSPVGFQPVPMAASSRK
jgi:hypothetical protein